jgi:hypothetical protein
MDNNQDMRRILAGFNKLTARKNINESRSIYECPPDADMSSPAESAGGQISITGDVSAIGAMLSQLASIESSGKTTNLTTVDDPAIPGVDRNPFDSDSDEGLLGNIAGSAAGAMAGTALGGPVGGAIGSVAGGAIGNKMTDEEDYANAPEEDYRDTDYMTKDIAGGLNGEKGAYADAEDGDNPMAVKERHEQPMQGEFFDDDDNVTISWINDADSPDEIEITAYDEDDNEVNLDQKQIRHYQEMIRDEMQRNADEEGDAKMHAQQDDDRDAMNQREMAVEEIKARLYKALSEAAKAPWEKEGEWSKKIKKQEKEYAKKPTSEASKPDFLDVDKDGDKKEPFKKAVKDKGKVAEEEATLERNSENKLKKDVHTAKVGHAADIGGHNYSAKKLEPLKKRSGDSADRLKSAIAKMKRAGRAEQKHGKDAGYIKTLNDFGKDPRNATRKSK